MQRCSLVLLVTASWLLMAGTATAETVEISYTITGGTVIADEDPETVTGGQFKVTLPAATKYSLLAGYGTLQSFSIMAFGITPSGYASTAVTARLTSPRAVYGYATGFFFPIQSLLLTGTDVVHCFAPDPYCGLYGLTMSVPKVFDLNVSVSFNYPNSFAAFSPGLGSGIVLGLYSLVGESSGRVTVNYTGQEIARVFVPEPGQSWLAAGTLASVGALGLWVSRRRHA